MIDTGPSRSRTTTALTATLVAVIVGACGFGGNDDGPHRDRTDRNDPPPADVVITPNGLPGLQLNRQVLDISTTDVETAFGGKTFSLAGQTDECGLATNEALKVAAVTDTDLAVVAFIVERTDAATREGISLGSTTDDIVEAYGKNAVFAREVPSRDGGELIWVTDLDSPGSEPTAASLHYAFDTDTNGQVTRIRAGFWPHVAHADFCSDDAGRSTATGWPLT